MKSHIICSSVPKYLNFGYSKIDDFFIPNDGISKKFKQSTSVFSYFFIKTILFNFETLVLFLNNNMKNFNFLNKKKYYRI